jgi:Protein of unknown function (DUF1232)
VETILLMILIAGASGWAYKQWKSLPPQGGGGLMVRPGDTIIEAGAWQAETPEPKAKLNKYVILGLCIAYILFPLDFIPDVFPVVGWGDDLAAGIIGIKALFRRA